MNAYYFYLLIAKIKNSQLVKDIKDFYLDEPWPATFVFAGLMCFFGFMSYLFTIVIYLTWPTSLYVIMSVLAIIATTRAFLNWISKE